MADSTGAPRRVSMAYILGFSNKPFKDGGPPAPPPAPRHPSAFKQMVTAPGGVIEWTASDGRRGRLTGPGKPRLTATNLAQVPEGKAVSVKAASKKDTVEDDGDIFGALLGGDAPATPASVKDDNKSNNSHWTKEQDERLLELRGENPKGPWDDVAKEIDNGQQGRQCKDRFNKIKPKNWKPNNAQGGGGSKQNQGKQNGPKNQQGGGKKDEEKKEGAPDGGFDATAWPGGNDNNGWGNTNGTGGGGGNDNSGENGTGNNDATWGAGNDTWGGVDNKSEKKDDSADPFAVGWGAVPDNSSGDNKADESFNSASNGWGAGFGDNGATGNWQNAVGGGKDAWVNNNGSGDTAGDWSKDSKGSNDNGVPKDNASKKLPSNKGFSSNRVNKEPSNKAPSQSRSQRHTSQRLDKPTTSAPKEYELKPDSTFSGDDLRLIAKILQQDCSMVWNRVSWRFKDKTGRNLHPDVFEKKITGKIEDSGSEPGRR